MRMQGGRSKRRHELCPIRSSDSFRRRARRLRRHGRSSLRTPSTSEVKIRTCPMRRGQRFERPQKKQPPRSSSRRLFWIPRLHAQEIRQLWITLANLACPSDRFTSKQVFEILPGTDAVDLREALDQPGCQGLLAILFTFGSTI